MREYENHVDSDWVGHTCGSIPVPMVTGTNRLFCGGRCIPGNDFSYLVGAQVLILSSVAAFVYGIVEESRHFVLAAIPIALMLVQEGLMLSTACMDPGIVPRDPYPVDVNPDTLLIRSGVAFKWCRTCHIYRPPRTKHCPVCDNCVDRFDHHCPWVGTCIGRRNYRYFFGFICVTLINSIFVLVTSIVLLLETDGFNHQWPWIMSATISALAVPLVGSLVLYHIYLVATNKTTNEDLNKVYEKEENPFTMGCYEDGCLLLCSRQRSSRLVPSSAPIQSW
eukprot:TRINITY_DN2289_c0_g1_i5.p1 TRINITY_DN2289_c0_g1~~TRINITY_DN2289_c0_g1_i5.p1  ORF type:complete len:279 (-),score=23.14 TRINITY_DN2289_c0_g1_i5:183-1019(-)